jgi:hypothetical protein
LYQLINTAFIGVEALVEHLCNILVHEIGSEIAQRQENRAFFQGALSVFPAVINGCLPGHFVHMQSCD